MSAIDDFKEDYKHEMQHVEELGSSLQPVGTTSEVEYPQALRDMEDAPSLDTLKAGLELQRSDSQRSIGSFWRMLLCAIPFLVAA
jgi:hypothetical protein